MPNSNGVRIEYTTNYIPSEDVTIIWQHVEIEDCDFIQRALVGWYYGEPDDKSNEYYSSMPLIAQLF